MTGFTIPSDKFYLSLENNRHVNVTPPWFSSKSKYPPRANNFIEPLINGERAFKAVYEAINAAQHSVEIISWGFDPSMRLIRPDGERMGALLQRKAEKDGVEIRVLIWKEVLSNFKENTTIGDGLLGSGGGTALGSGVGGLESNGGEPDNTDEFNEYGGKVGNSAGIIRDDDEAKEFNRKWFRYQDPKLEFRTRDFSTGDRLKNYNYQFAQRGMSSLRNIGRTIMISDFSSHHQKMILVDYEHPDKAIGFVMGHNLLRNYWDTDEHEYRSTARLGFAPWQDLSSRVRGPILFDLNENFVTAWDKAEGQGSKFFWHPERKDIKPQVFEKPALQLGKGEMAQICRTQPQEGERAILNLYQIALSNARQYVYFENQYFRYKELADLIRNVRRKLKQNGWKRDFYIFVVTNVPPDAGRVNTYEMLAALGKASTMPTIHKKEGSNETSSEAALRKADLDGIHIHVATLATCAQIGQEMRYKEIYVHSKLMLIDDVFFTLGSANINVRSMEADSELNIACPSPELTRQLREQLWKIHTRKAPSEDMTREFDDWGKIMTKNLKNKETKKPLVAPLLEFFDDGTSKAALD